MITFDDGRWIRFLYDASGAKLRKERSDGYVKDYVSGIEYENGVLEAIYHEEGRAVFKNNNFEYQYRIADHLNNTRVLFRDDGNGIAELLNENHFYSFGLQMNGLWHQQTNPEQNYLYNGKELDSDFGLNLYHYGFRMFDPAVARFTGVDPISDKFPHVSTFNYAENSPIVNIDLHGLQALHYGATSSYTGEGRKFVEQNPKAAAAIAVGFVAAPVLAVAGAEAGPAAVGSFLLNEIKDEVLSQVTGGASDILSLRKTGKNIISKTEMASITGGTNTSDLTEMAQAFHSTLHFFKQKLTTTAVTETVDNAGNIKYVVGHSDKYLPKAIKDSLGSNDIGASGISGHAEVSAITKAKQEGLTPVRVGASRPICTDCQEFSRENGVLPVGPLKK